jgi:hypothetical protein
MTADIKLPPLADCAIFDPGRWGAGWRAEQMQSYATAAILADRERAEGVMRTALTALVYHTQQTRTIPATEEAIAALREHLKEPR